MVRRRRHSRHALVLLFVWTDMLLRSFEPVAVSESIKQASKPWNPSLRILVSCFLF